jgi:hypothetical protein
MADVQQAKSVPHSPTPRWPRAQAACIDLDRFCIDCGYNLRTQVVSLDDRTGIPVVRCPECGRYQSANDTSTALRPWIDRLSSVLLVGWMIAILVIFIYLAIGEVAISYATLDELTIHGGYTTQRIGNTTTTTWNSSQGSLEVKKDVPEYILFMAVILTASFGLAFFLGLYVVVVFPHWRRMAYVVIVVVTPLVAAILIALVWRGEAPHLFTWGLTYVSVHAALQIIGGLFGVSLGRPLARLLVRILLPPCIRPRLAYLWLADGKPAPRPQ